MVGLLKFIRVGFNYIVICYGTTANILLSVFVLDFRQELVIPSGERGDRNRCVGKFAILLVRVLCKIAKARGKDYEIVG